MKLPIADLVVFIIITLGNVLFVIIWMSLSPLYFNSEKLLAFKSPFHSNLTIVFGTLAIFLVGFIVLKLFPGKKHKTI